MEPHILDISRVIQLAVAPVFLLTAISTMINAMNARLGRIVDRRRLVQDSHKDVSEVEAGKSLLELRSLEYRAHLAYLGIFFSVLAAFLVCLVVAGAFVGALISVDLEKTIAITFILAMLSMIVSLGMFLREVYLGVSFRAHINR